MKFFRSVSTALLSYKLEEENKRELARRKRQYKLGDYSGHPEEMLTSIDSIERSLEQIRLARAKGYTPNLETVAWYEEQIVTPDRSPAQIEFYVKQIKRAHRGVI